MQVELTQIFIPIISEILELHVQQLVLAKFLIVILHECTIHEY